MVDVHDGSDTKVLVKQVLQWEKDNRDPQNADMMFSSPHFQKLYACYQEVYTCLQELNNPAYDDAPEFIEGMEDSAAAGMVCDDNSNNSDDGGENKQ